MTIASVTAGNKILATKINEIIDGVNAAALMQSAGSAVSISLINGVFGKFYTDDGAFLVRYSSVSSCQVCNLTTGLNEVINFTDDWADATAANGFVKIGNYFYVLLYDSSPAELRVYRYDITSLSSGGTQMTESIFGATSVSGVKMTSDGTDLFFSNNAGNGDIVFGDGTTRYDVTDQGGGTYRYTYNSTGTAPLFVTNGLAVGQPIDIAGGDDRNNGQFVVTAVAETYFEVSNAETTIFDLQPSSAEYDDNFVDNSTYNHSTDFSGCVEKPTTSNVTMSLISFEVAQGGEYEFSCDLVEITTGGFRLAATHPGGTTTGSTDSSTTPFTYTLSFVADGPGTITPRIQNNSGVHKSNNYNLKKLSGVAETGAALTLTQVDDPIIIRASISGTTLTEEDTTICGVVAGIFDNFAVKSDMIVAVDSSGYDFYIYNRSGVLQTTIATPVFGSAPRPFGLEDKIMLHDTISSVVFTYPFENF